MSGTAIKRARRFQLFYVARQARGREPAARQSLPFLPPISNMRGMRRAQKMVMAMGLLLGFGIVVHTLFDPQGLPKRQRLTRELEAVHNANERLRDEAKALRGQIEALRTRPEVQERVIRDELGYVQDGDVILELPETPSNSPAPSR